MTRDQAPLSVGDYVRAIDSPRRRRDAEALIELMSRATGEPPRMWSSSIVGFGRYVWHNDSGRRGEGPAASFSARKLASTIYLADGVAAHQEELEMLGAHTTGVGCLYIKDVAAVDGTVLEGVVRASYTTLTADTFRHRAHEAGRRAAERRMT